ncbi:guanine nucleotide-binding beta subunit [Micractinium conductrix]|uniref:Guanine nucleotide-binding beta subunit n=1 Tax=Micractinium conductrix TaxID=554055 RepID=A0A2P6VN87_9CHLO|nr:guanine nucleotide-binding beta subunit [Micractinium conductrix]|eukprot:PSC75543.1 guanine nucleotide-binding beta subunit [Micractinium conductrix]
MRINIQLEVEPGEVPLATELLGVLRQLTDHVTVKTVGAADGTAATASTASRGPSPLPPAAASQPSTPANSVPSVSMPPAPSGAAAELQHAASGGLVAPAAAPPAAPPAVPFPPGTPPQQMMRELVQQSELAEHLEPLTHQLESIIREPAYGGVDVMFPQFVDIWSSIALYPSLCTLERSAVPFVMLLQAMSQTLRDKFRDRIMRDLLKHLTVVRPLNANRGEYYVHAEAFAALVSIEIVPIEGSIRTMCTLAKTAEKRGAAVTMLGKTVELAGHVIHEKVSPAVQELMRTTVAGITDQEFQYDVDFINNILGWSAGGAAPGGVPAAGAARTLHPAHSIPDAHGEMIFALAVDAAHQQLVSCGKDSYIRVWSQDGQPLQTLGLEPNFYTSSVDFHPRLNMLLASCINNQVKTSLHLAGFTSGNPNGLVPQGKVRLPDMIALATVRALPDTNGFITGESVQSDPSTSQAAIRFWDMAAASSFSSLQPTQTFRGHGSIATALRGVTGEASLFVSGDKDGSMLLWDLRAPTPVGGFGAPNPVGGAQKAHNMMVTSIESAGPIIISASTDKTVALWDVRRLNSQEVSRVHGENMTVLKLALNASQNMVAVSAISGLRLLDIANPAAPVLSDPLAFSWPDGRKRAAYHDVRWNEPLGLLYGAGKDKLIDMYTLA